MNILTIQEISKITELMKKFVFENDDDNDDYCILVCKINKINDAWKNAEPDKNTNIYYIDENINKITNINKFNESYNNLINMEVFKPPQISFADTDDNNEIVCFDKIIFIDGRNRFSNLRNSGCIEMPFIIEKIYKKTFETHYCD